MKQIITIREADISAHAPDVNPSDLVVRKAARAILRNNERQIVLLHVRKNKYHKLPGGGIEDGESIMVALRREILEEVGCEAEIYGEVGEAVEYRDQTKMKQYSYCYLAKQIGELKDPSYTAEEEANGFEIMWVDSIDTAISLIEKDRPTDYAGKFIVKRDLALLKAAKESM